MTRTTRLRIEVFLRLVVLFIFHPSVEERKSEVAQLNLTHRNVVESTEKECIGDSAGRGCRHTPVQEVHKQSSIPIVERSWIVT